MNIEYRTMDSSGSHCMSRCEFSTMESSFGCSFSPSRIPPLTLFSHKNILTPPPHLHSFFFFYLSLLHFPHFPSFPKGLREMAQHSKAVRRRHWSGYSGAQLKCTTRQPGYMATIDITDNFCYAGLYCEVSWDRLRCVMYWNVTIAGMIEMI